MIIQSVTQISAINRPRYIILLEVIYANYKYYLKSKRAIVEIVTVNTILRLTYIFFSGFLRWYYRTEITIPKELYFLTKDRFIIVANHRRAIDPFLLLSALPAPTFRKILPVRMFTANIFMEHLWQRILMTPFGCFRAYFKHGKLSGVKGGLKLSDAGQTLLIFPEGKRVKTKVKVEPQVGIAYLAKKRNFTFIPVYIDYGNFASTKKTTIRWGKPFMLNNEMNSDDLKVLTNYIFEKVQALSHHT